MGPGCRYIDSDDGGIFQGKFYNPENPRKKWKNLISGLKDYNPPVADTLLICVDDTKHNSIMQEDNSYDLILRRDHNAVKSLLRKTVAVPDSDPVEDKRKTAFDSLRNRYQAIMNDYYLDDSDKDYEVDDLPSVPSGPDWGVNPKYWLTRPPVTGGVPDDSGKLGYPSINQINERAANTPHFVKDRKTINSFIKVVANNDWDEPLEKIRRLARGLEVYGQINFSEDQKTYIKNKIRNFLVPNNLLSDERMSKMENIDFSAWYEIHRLISGF